METKETNFCLGGEMFAAHKKVEQLEMIKRFRFRKMVFLDNIKTHEALGFSNDHVRYLENRVDTVTRCINKIIKKVQK